MWHIYPNASYENFRLISRIQVACKYAQVFINSEIRPYNAVIAGCAIYAI